MSCRHRSVLTIEGGSPSSVGGIVLSLSVDITIGSVLQTVLPFFG